MGQIGEPTGKYLAAGCPLINPSVQYADLYNGLQIAGQEPLITLIVIPDAVLLKTAEYATLIKDVLDLCGKTESCMGLFDIRGGEDLDPETYTGDAINPFRDAVGLNNLKYGVAYFPFLCTSIVEDTDINFLNLGGAATLAKVLPNADMDPLRTILRQIQCAAGPTRPTDAQLENALLAFSDEYNQLHAHVLAKINVLPPSGAIAGVYTAVDNVQGVWKAPANVSLATVTDTTLKLTDSSQQTLNVHTLTGKSINAIRLFPGSGVLVWGARTLDGNSQDWRYVNVRRTVIMIEQSIKLAVRAYVFAPNVSNTWSLVQSMITSFLSGIWSQGGLAGSTAADAFLVEVGLGVTMTAEDILNGIMNVTVQVAVSHPAKFIVINLSQMMQT